MVELSVYNDITSLIPVDKSKSACSSKVVDEMENRYELFSHFGCAKYPGYNAKVEEFNAQSEQNKSVATDCVIVDELADLMMVASKEVKMRLFVWDKKRVQQVFT